MVASRVPLWSCRPALARVKGALGGSPDQSSTSRVTSRPARDRGRAATNPRASRNVHTLLRSQHLRPEKSDEQPRVSGPCVEEQLPRNLPAGIPQRQHDNDDIVERPEDRDELGNQVDW